MHRMSRSCEKTETKLRAQESVSGLANSTEFASQVQFNPFTVLILPRFGGSSSSNISANSCICTSFRRAVERTDRAFQEASKRASPHADPWPAVSQRTHMK